MSTGRFGGLGDRDVAHPALRTEGATNTCVMTEPGGLGGDYPPGAGAMRTGQG